jgi:ELWxxDGT repeat protein
MPVECGADEPEELAVLNGVVIFSAQDGGSGRELWSSDGTADGTHLIKDISPGAGPSASSNPRRLTVVGSRIFFAADDGTSGSELWMTDGTTAGTQLVKDIFPGRAGSDPQALSAAGTRLAFVALDPARGRELHVSDGTAAGTVMTEDFVPGPLDGAINRTAGRTGGVFWFGRAPADSRHRLRFTALP